MKLNQLRRIGVVSVSAMFIIVLHTHYATAKEVNNLNEAMTLLSKEKSLAESYALTHNPFGKADMRKYAKGIRLYDQTKAKFDGLLELLKYNLKR